MTPEPQGSTRLGGLRPGQSSPRPDRITTAEDFEAALRSEGRGFFVTDPALVSKLYEHYCLLLRWNRVVRLTTVTELREAIRRHYCESLFLASKLPLGAGTVMDFGSGAGFPGIPIAAARPEMEVVLVERRRRKAAFLREATRGWNNVKVFGGEAAELQQTFDWVVSRAVNPVEVLTEAKGRAKSVALLLGQSGAEALASRKDVAWREPIALPWGDRRVLLMGELTG